MKTSFPSLNLPSAELQSRFLEAIESGDIIQVRFLLAEGAELHPANWDGRTWTPLMAAHNHPDVLRELLDAGAEVNTLTTLSEMVSPVSGRKITVGGETALHLAVKANNADSVRLLVQAGADIEAGAERGAAPLDVAVRTGTLNASAEALIAAGAKLTPTRLELLHMGALEPEANLDQYLSMRASAGNSTIKPAPGPAKLQPAPEPPRVAPGEVNCPHCHAPLYSRRPKLCGSCGKVLPAELVLSDEQAKALEDQRQWARELAEAFDTTGDRGVVRSTNVATGLGSAVQTIATSKNVAPVSCAEEFRKRPRPFFWFLLIGQMLLITAMAFTIELPVSSWVGILIILAPATFITWKRSTPVCPNCRQNIRFCAAEFCHRCGRPLRHGRCNSCGVDNTWTGLLIAFRHRGNWSWIVHCPGCGAFLDTMVSRWHSK
ncbi:MAG TPA: ankyrin repeat domain-containing protein [Candidatus Dormibacteraeota bacterium]|nr:ankyrin repeat domain-containing protein [Candidatus Dormibacteraeota bacterium]